LGPGVDPEQAAVGPAAPDPGGDVVRRGPRSGHQVLLSRRERYSSIVIVWSREEVPVGLSTKPIAWTYGSMTCTFCSGVTMRSWSPSLANSSSAYRVETSDPRPNASSITANLKSLDFAAPHSSPNW